MTRHIKRSEIKMNHSAGLLGVACAWMMILMQDLVAGSALKKHAAGAPCKLKDLAALAKHQVEESLARFDKDNGKDLGTWSPGFPELQVHQNSPVYGSKVQCSLHFMTTGLEEILEDQEHNLNPQDVSLHKKLRDTISRVKMLEACVENTLGGKCPHKPPPPKMPEHVFERKQWSHTLLKSARRYLDWLENKVQVSKVKRTNLYRVIKASLQNYFGGSVYQL